MGKGQMQFWGKTNATESWWCEAPPQDFTWRCWSEATRMQKNRESAAVGAVSLSHMSAPLPGTGKKREGHLLGLTASPEQTT
jgi:hypothetical protein